MAKSISLTYHLSRFISSSSSTTTKLTFLSQSQFLFPSSLTFSFRPLSTTPTPYPLQYDLIINRPPPQSPRPPPVRSNSSHNNDAFSEPDEPELRLDSWVDRKLAEPGSELDKSKRKYYNKRRKRMYGGSDEDEDGNRRTDEPLIELKPQVIEFPTLHKREEELYFYDAFSYPWEKEKHYKMVYQLEKKYFPDQCLDKAFLQPGEKQNQKHKQSNEDEKKAKKKDEDKKLVFFEGEKEKSDSDVTEKKVEEFFKGLKKKNKVNNDEDNGLIVGDGNVNGGGEPFFSSRRTGLPPVWDSPHGTVLLINKPKG